jgi:hypothetical protein
MTRSASEGSRHSRMFLLRLGPELGILPLGITLVRGGSDGLPRESSQRLALPPGIVRRRMRVRGLQ